MRDQFRLERYEVQLFTLRYICVFIILYAVGLVAYLHVLFKDKLWLMILGAVAIIVIARFMAGFFSNMVSKKNKKGRELVFLPLGVIPFACYAFALMQGYEETSWVEMGLLILFVGIVVYGIYLAHYIRYVQGNRDADYMAVYHVTIGNLRAYRLWYLATVLLVLAVAILPFWKPLNNAWGRMLSTLRARLDSGQNPGGWNAEPGTNIPDVPFNPEEEPFEPLVEAAGGAASVATIIAYVLASAFIIFAMVQMVRILMTKITDAKTSMETDRVIDLKKTLIPIQDEVVRIRDDNVVDENAYARRIRRTFKRAVFDRFGDVDIPERTPEELLGTGRPQENDDVLLEKYEKARYSNIPCTPEDVKAVRPQK